MSLKETKFYTTKCYTIETGHEGEDPFRVAIIGDLHISPIVSEKQCYAAYLELSKIEDLELIIIQGDMVDSPTELYDTASVKKLKDTLKMCARMAPTVAVLGGHDIIIPREPAVEMDVVSTWKEICEECNVRLLLDEWYETEHLAVFGLYQDAEFVFGKNRKRRDNPKVMEKKLAELSESGKLSQERLAELGESGELSQEFPEKVHWFVAHAPLINRGVIRALANFQVASFGHTHGGCVPLVVDLVVDKFGGNTGLVSPEKKPFPKMVRGRMTLPTGTELIINSGMIATHYSAAKGLQYLNGFKQGEVTEVTLIGKPEEAESSEALHAGSLRDSGCTTPLSSEGSASSGSPARDESFDDEEDFDEDWEDFEEEKPKKKQAPRKKYKRDEDEDEDEEDYDEIDDREEEEEERRRREREERIQEILEAERNKRRGRKAKKSDTKKVMRRPEKKKRKRPKRELDDDYDEDWDFDDDFDDDLDE